MLFLALGLTALLVNLCTGIEAPLPGYGVEELQWKVQAFVDGPEMNISGTIEQVYAQLVKINPDYDEHLKNMTQAHQEFSNRAAASTNCKPAGQGWSAAKTDRIGEGIGYLRTVGGAPTNGPGPGPGNCGRVSCSYNAAIWWCNDNRRTFSLPTFSTIGVCAQAIVDDCSSNNNVLGQRFYPDNWNCIVRRDTDKC